VADVSCSWVLVSPSRRTEIRNERESAIADSE
jgi:hypothetical protein